MNSLGHIGITAVVFAPILGWLWWADRYRDAIVCGLLLFGGSLAPDIDLYVDVFAHRGLTHTVWAAGFGVLGGGGVGVLICQRGNLQRCGLYGLLGGVGVLLHLLGDVVTPMGIKPFTPIGEWNVTLGLVLSHDPTPNYVAFGAGVAALAVTFLCRTHSRNPRPLISRLTGAQSALFSSRPREDT